MNTPAKRKKARRYALNRAMEVSADAQAVCAWLCDPNGRGGVTYEERRQAIEVVLRLRRRVRTLLDTLEHLPCEPEPEALNTTTLKEEP